MGESTGHTPGPWEIVWCHGWPLGIGIRTTKKGDSVNAFTMIGNTMSKKDRDAELPVVTANARLIAAAPDLLEACKTLLAVVGQAPDFHEVGKSALASEALALGEAAIAKATK